MRRLRFAGGPIFTGDPADPWVEAVLVEGARVLAVGTEERVHDIGRDAEPFDLAGDTLVPGFVDAHNHFLATGETLGSLDVHFPAVGSAADLLDVVASAAASTPSGAAITGSGLDTGKFAIPPLDDLDRAAGDHPLYLHHISGHAALVNGTGFALAGVPAEIPDPPGGRFDRDRDGRLTGLCFDAAMGLVMPTAVDVGTHGPNFHVRSSPSELVDAVERAGRAFLGAGLTTVCDAQVTVRELGAYRAAREQDRLLVRTVCMPLSHQLDAFRELGLAGPFGDDRLWIGPLKIYADDTLTGGTAAFDPALGVRSQTGSWYHEPEALRDLIATAWADGWRIGVHAQGDAAIAAVLDGFERGASAHPRPDPRPRIEHAGYPRSSGVARMASLGAIAVTQPTYLADFGDEYLASLGEHGHDLQPWRDLLAARVRVVISSDSDVTTYRPLATIANAMRRTSRSGTVIGERHRLSLDEALLAHTSDAAFAIGMEDQLGSLRSGTLADLAVIGGDLRAMAPEEVERAPVRATVVGGERVV
jgi:predicted amidohydrolase YtcJ